MVINVQSSTGELLYLCIKDKTRVFTLFTALKLSIINGYNSLLYFKVNIWGELLLPHRHLQQRHDVREVRGQPGQHHQPVHGQVRISDREFLEQSSFFCSFSSSWSLSETFSFRFSTSTPGAVRLDFNNKIFTNNKNRKRYEVTQFFDGLLQMILV